RRGLLLNESVHFETLQPGRIRREPNWLCSALIAWLLRFEPVTPNRVVAVAQIRRDRLAARSRTATDECAPTSTLPRRPASNDWPTHQPHRYTRSLRCRRRELWRRQTQRSYVHQW